MAYKVINKGARGVGVKTPAGIRAVKAGGTAEFSEILNLEALKAVKGVTVSGEVSEPTEDDTTSSDEDDSTEDDTTEEDTTSSSSSSSNSGGRRRRR